MAEERDSNYIWVSWLAKIMSGDITCHWQSWFLTRNKLTEKQPSDFDLVGWTIDHTKMLTELKEKLIKENHKPVMEQTIRYELPGLNSSISAKPDCMIEKGSDIIIYDCKTGNERASDQVQVMLYMYFLSKIKSSIKQIKGVILYKDKEIEIPHLPENFEENFNYFVGILTSSTPPTKNPGDDCKFCNITENDCSERI